MPLSFQPIIDDRSECLILGSLPSVISLKERHYYANPHNQFWEILYSVFGEEMPTDFGERYRFLLRHHLALWDVVKSADRKGSLDSSIRSVVPNDIPGLLAEHPEIRKIILSGAASERYFMKYFGFLSERYECRRVPSPSPIPGRNVRTLDEKKAEWSKALR